MHFKFWGCGATVRSDAEKRWADVFLTPTLTRGEDVPLVSGDFGLTRFAADGAEESRGTVPRGDFTAGVAIILSIAAEPRGVDGGLTGGTAFRGDVCPSLVLMWLIIKLK